MATHRHEIDRTLIEFLDRAHAGDRSEFSVWYAVTSASCPFRISPDHNREYRSGFRSPVTPSMTRAVLYDDIAGREMTFLVIVQFQPKLSRQQDDVVDGLRCVRSGVLRFEGLGKAGQSAGVFGTRGVPVIDGFRTLSGGKTTFMNRVSPGAATREVIDGTGSVTFPGMAGSFSVAQRVDTTKPGTCMKTSRWGSTKL